MDGIKVYLVGDPGSGKSLLARELKRVLQRYGVTCVVSVQRNEDVQITRDYAATIEWAETPVTTVGL